MMNTVVGMVYFEDYKEMIPWHTFLFLLGVMITLTGVFLLSKRDPSTKPKPSGQIQEEGGYIEEVVSSLDDSEMNNNGEGVLGDLPPPLTKVEEHENEESEVRNPFIDASTSGRDLATQGKVFSGSSLSGSPLSPSASSLSENSKMKPLDIGDVEDEDEVDKNLDNLNGAQGNDGPNPIHHPPNNKASTRNHSRSFSLSWSWWARGGTRKLYTPLF